MRPLLLVPLGVLLPGCAPSDSLSRYVGRRCTVRVRPDVLGAAATIPVPVETDNLNGASVAASGKLVSVDDDWLTLEKPQGATVLIARPQVLSVGIEADSNP